MLGTLPPSEAPPRPCCLVSALGNNASPPGEGTGHLGPPRPCPWAAPGRTAPEWGRHILLHFLCFSKRMCCAGKSRSGKPHICKPGFPALESADKAWLIPEAAPGSRAGAAGPAAQGPEGCRQVTGTLGSVPVLPILSPSFLAPRPHCPPCPTPLRPLPHHPEVRFQHQQPDVARGCWSGTRTQLCLPGYPGRGSLQGRAWEVVDRAEAHPGLVPCGPGG